MLHQETVDQPTLELLKKLQGKEYLKGFHLAGGTALALTLGHRKSVDLDLFSDFNFDAGALLENISADFQFHLFFSANNTLKGSIDGVQVDILAHRYPMITEPLELEGISMLAKKDIVAMKLNAITVNGQRVKDFIDIFYLLEEFSIAEMLGFYKIKYAQYNEVNVLKSLTWFEDVDLSEWPVLLKSPQLKWGAVTKKIISATHIFLDQM